LLTLGPLNHLENQSLEREKIKSIPRVGDLWIPLDITILECCAQFYMLEIDDRIKTRGCILRISHIRQVMHLLSWMYVRDFYGRLCWKYIGRNDANYSIKIDNKRKRVVDFKKEEDVLAIEDLKQIIL
jgi:hypothetical protein